jgi:hypothetical protein
MLRLDAGSDTVLLGVSKPLRKGSMMKRIVFVLVGAISLLSAYAGPAAASGPAPKGKEVVEIQCEGLGSLTVSVPRSEKNWGAGQVVGQKGHGIPTAVSFSATDLRTGEVLASENSVKGGGHANSHQPATNCSATFEVPASEFFEGQLPEEVEPDDTIRVDLLVKVVIKL